MPIPVYQQRTNAPSNLQLATRQVDPNALGALGNSLLSLSDFAKQKQEERAAVFANESLMSARAKWVEELPKRQAAASESGEGYALSVLQAFDEDSDERIKLAPTAESRQYLKQRLSETRLAIQQDSLQFEARRGVEYKANGLERSINTARTAVEFSPDAFGTVLAEQRAAVEASGLPADLQAKYRTASQYELASASVEGAIRRDAAAALKELNNEKTENLAVRALSFERRQQLRSVAEATVRRDQDRRERLADRREAKAERTIAGIDRQIASGVPLTAEMWGQAQELTKGTALEGEFKSRLADEQEVQSLLRKPFGEQLKYVQEKEAALAGGGSLRDAQNVARLKATVNQNIQLLNQSPLLFDQRRSGTEVQPLDFSQAGSDEFAGQLADRVDTLKGMRRQLGTQVPLKPLLPQEAAQLTAALNGSTPKQQAELFSTLYTSVGDPAAFKGAMQQIAPDAPVKALAGILAGKQEQVKTKDHWFSPDETVRGVDVAQTLLQGESLLNATAAEKQGDGRPKVGLFLPDQVLLQTEFQNAVGDAFQGRPGGADVAFQAVKSYYVGRAAQLGRIASTKEDVDTGLVKEAVTAVLGSTSDYNGGGTVIAPWGMDESTFSDRADAAFRVQAERAGIPAERIDALADNIGLRNAGGESQYYVTTGKNFLTDKAGKPIVIDLDDRALPWSSLWNSPR